MGLFGRLNREHWHEFVGVLLVIFTLWMIASLLGYGGRIGDWVSSGLYFCIGHTSFLMALIIGYWGVSFFLNAKRGLLSGILGSFCLLLGGLIFLWLFTSGTRSTVGIIGERLGYSSVRWIGTPGLCLFGFVFLVLGVTLSSELTFTALFNVIYSAIKNLIKRPQKEVFKPSVSKKRVTKEKEKEKSSKPSEAPVVIFDGFKEELSEDGYLRKPSTVKPYVIPPLSLLDRINSEDEEVARDVIRERAKILESSFASFNIEARVMRVNRGPVITRYEVEPGPGVKVSKFVNLADDLALVLRATRVRVVAPVPGEGVVGIEVPNEVIALVGLREVLESQEFRKSKSKLALPLGKDISGKPVIADLSSMPHLLIAGTTGSGKSVFINSVICSMLFRMTPDEIRFLMIDPKMVELKAYDGIPHLMAPVVTDSTRAPAYLKWALREVEKRYKRLADLGVRNIDGYNRYMVEHPEVIGTKIEGQDLVHGKLPYIVIIIDELADLMLVASSEIDTSITRLAQIARAAGVHMLVSTQRPSVNVITGSIKANLPCRISFRLASMADSRTILDMNGAESLMGKGDMLFLNMNAAKPVRAQSCYVSEAEVERIVDFIKQHFPARRTEIENLEEEQDKDDIEEDDSDLYDQAVELITKYRIVSASFLQNKLLIKRDRAESLIQRMEMEGLVGPSMGNRPREILIEN